MVELALVGRLGVGVDAPLEPAGLPGPSKLSRKFRYSMLLEAVIDSRPGTSDMVTLSPVAVSSTDERGHTVVPLQRSSSWTVSESAKAGVVPSASHSPTSAKIQRTPGQYPVDSVLVLRTRDQFPRRAEPDRGGPKMP